ncbi:hypothetical protein [Pseudolysinimonas sp.]|uniref:hypothetical protein n=1 Tax=Pseudolysinimonas sp. TaxID=2680009 RepID=UPI003F7F51DC
MSRRRPLPTALLGGPFTTAEALDLGVDEHRLRASDVAHPYHGVGTVGPTGGDIRARCRVYAPRLLPGQIFSHTTALQLHGAAVPTRTSHRLHLSVAFPRTPPRTVGAVGHSLRHPDPVMRSGLPVSAPAAAWCEAAAALSREELVAAGDALVTGPRRNGRRERAATDIAALASALDRRRGARGIERARWALGRIRAGVDSPRETELRLLLLRHRLPEPEVDVPVAVSGRVLHADLGYPDRRLLIEYEGDVHRVDRQRWMRDIRRRELMEDAGHRVIRVVAADLRDPAPLLARVRRHLARS